jgi:gliding motility-associated-like protein
MNTMHMFFSYSFSKTKLHSLCPKLFSVFLLFLITFSAHAQESSNIIGPEFVCVRECYTYRLSEPVSPAPSWQVTDGSGNPVSFTLLEAGLAIQVCFGSAGPFTISAITPGGIERKVIFPGSFTELNFSASIGECPPIPIGECLEVCTNSLFTISIEDILPALTNWNFFPQGAVQILQSDNRQIKLLAGNETGTYFLTYFGYTSSQCVYEGNLCIRVIPQPEVSYTSSYPASNDTISLCSGQELTITNTSNGNFHQWIFGNGSQSTDNNIKLNFSSAEQSEIRLRTFNALCACESEKKITIIVNEAPGANIYCTGTICDGDTVTYFSDPDCVPYLWNIGPGGTVVAGGTELDDFIRIRWQNSSLGGVSLTNACSEACPIHTEISIPIIGNNQIQGPIRICAGERYTYQTDPIGGAEFLWQIAGGGRIISGEGSNVIQVEFFAGSPQKSIILSYNNCQLECSGSDTLDVLLSNRFGIDGPTAICQGEFPVWRSRTTAGNPLSVQWELRDNSNIIVTTGGPSDVFSWPTNIPTGVYSLIAKEPSGNFCNTMSNVRIEVIAPPQDIQQINGPSVFCPGSVYTYTALPVDGASTTIWTLIQNTDTTEYRGNTVQLFLRESSDYQLFVHRVNPLSNCGTDTLERLLQPLDSFQISAAFQDCIFGEGVFRVEGEQLGKIIWTFSAPEKVNLLHYPDGQSVRVKWLSEGNVQINADYCGANAPFNINILPPFEPEILFDTIACNNAPQLVQTALPWQSYRWYEGAVLLSESSSVLLPAGNYTLEVEDSEGCRGLKDFSIQRIDLPTIKLFTKDGVGLCPGDSTPISSTFYPFGNYIYTWWFEGNPLPETDNVLYAKQAGVYWRTVQDPISGCIERSNPVEICDFCETGIVCLECPCLPGDCCGSPGKADVILDTLRFCNAFEFRNNTPQMIPGSEQWRILTPSNQILIFTGSVLNITLREFGTYIVQLRGLEIDSNGDTLVLNPWIGVVEINAQPDFSFEANCIGQPSSFTNQTRLLGATTINAIAWTFGDPALGNSTVSNPQFQFPTSGSYPVRLQITTDDGCVYDTIRVVNVNEVQPAQLVFDRQVCQDSFANFLVSPSTFTRNIWYFSDPTPGSEPSDDKNPARQGYTQAGTFNFEVHLRDPNGCVQILQDSIVVLGSPQPGMLLPNVSPPYCEGDTVVLRLLDLFDGYLWNDGSTTSELKVTGTGIYNVTVQDSNACSASTEPISLDFSPSPTMPVVLRSGTRVVLAPDTLRVCSGDEVIISFARNLSHYTYLWSTGSNANAIVFDDNTGLLPPGYHQYTATITDVNTGCTAEISQIVVFVSGTPDVPLLNSNLPPPLCSPDSIRFDITNPDFNLMYFWSNGLSGSSIEVNSPGTYFVRAVNEYGCTVRSQPISVFGPPGFDFLPEGCFEACESDTICLPERSGFEWVSWFRDGDLIVPQPTDPGAPILDQSGRYHALIRTIAGCVYETPGFDYTIVPGLGAIGGIVFEDSNNDSLFNTGEPLLSGIRIIIEGNGIRDTINTNTLGAFYFRRLPIGQYLITIDTSSLPDSLNARLLSFNAEITSCNEELMGFGIPAITCVSDTTQFSFQLCPGDSLLINDVWITFEKDATFQVEIPDRSCTDINEYTIRVFDSIPERFIELEACEGEVIDIGGIPLERDTLIRITLQSIQGCDSVLVYQAKFNPLETEEIFLRFCPETSIEFRGIPIDSDTGFIFRAIAPQPNQCDTLISVRAQPYMVEWPGLQLQNPCPGESDGVIRFSGNRAYRLTLNGTPLGNISSISGLQAGAYQLILEDNNSCIQILDLSLDEAAPLVAQIQDITLSCGEEGELVVEVSSGVDSLLSFLWQNGERGDRLLVNRPGTFLVDVKNSCQQQRLRGTVIDLDSGNKRPFFVPSAFTPNDDGYNDGFKSYWSTDAQIQSFLFEVFDRWGNLQFRTNDPEASWNGFIKNEQDKIHTYVWHMTATVVFCNEILVLKDYGDVTLIR